MFRPGFSLTLLSLVFLTRNPIQTADKMNLNTTSKPSQKKTLSAIEQAVFISDPCPKECHCQMFWNLEYIGVFCRVNALEEDKYFSELNRSNYRRGMVIECNPNYPKESALSDGIFESLHAFVSLKIKYCQIAYISERAFSGMRSLREIVIQGGKISHFDEKSLQLPELFMLGAVTFTDTNLSVAPSLCDLDRLLYVNFSRNSLKRFKDTGMLCTNPGNIETIDISNNYIEDLPVRFSSVTSKLKCLVCAGNKIRRINKTLLENLTDIEKLNLKENRLAELPVAILGNNSKMQALELAYNKIEVLPTGIFSKVRNITFLNLDGMSLNNALWSELKYLTTLQLLYMNNNNLTSFDNETMCQLNELNRLEISGNIFQQIPNGTFAFQDKLSILNMSGNSITRIERASFDGLFSLVVLNLQNNQIKTIHSDALSQLHALQVLNISYNHLEIVPTFPKFLRVVDLRCNDIVFLDHDTFHGMSMLTEINLMSNRLRAITPYTFTTNEKLIILNLSSNKISYLFNNTFPVESRLECLILYNNSISTIEFFTNKIFPNLQLLDISHNKLSILAARNLEAEVLFPNSIKELVLFGNQIHFIQKDVFKLPFVTDIDLRMNRISTLRRETLQVPHHNAFPVSYYLEGNPFSCDCNLAWLNIPYSGYDDSYIIKDFSSLFCEKVYRHEPVLIKDLSRSRFLCTYTVHCNDDCECCNNAECVCQSYCPNNCTCYQNYKKEVDIVDCLGAKLQSVPEAVSANCTLFDLSGNNLTIIAGGTFKALSYLKDLYLNFSQIHQLKEGAFTGLYNLSILNLGYNFLQNLAPAMFKDLHRLIHLTISFNKIRWIEEKSFDPLANLQYLDLSGNELKTISRHEFSIMSKFALLKLSGNPWSCDCQYLELMNNFTLANAKQIVDLHKVVCERFKNSSNNGTEIHSLADLHLPDFCVNENQNEQMSSALGKSAVAVLGTALVICIVSLVTFGIGFRNREFLKVWCFVKFGWKFNQVKHKDEVNRSYDAFVAYSGHDESFIIRELVPYLEEPKTYREGFKLCLHHRDFPVGAPIAETIISAVGNSKRIIIVLSDNFLNSEWCQYEFQTAHHQLLQEKKNRIIMILLHDINTDLLDEELKLYLKTCTYVKYGDRWLWPKIEYAMPNFNRINVEDLGANCTDEFMDESREIGTRQLGNQYGDEIELIA